MLRGSTQSTKLFLESGVKFTGNALYFYQKLIFSQEGIPPDPLSYGMSDVNPHLTLTPPPPLLKSWIRPSENIYFSTLLQSTCTQYIKSVPLLIKN